MSCNLPPPPPNPSYVLTATNKQKGSTTMGNFVTSAIRRVYDLDMVFYPVDLLDETQVAEFKEGMSDIEKQKIVDLFPVGAADVFLLGTMQGKDIKEFILKRSQYRYAKDLEVAGLPYDIGFSGGFPNRQYFHKEISAELNDDENYKVAISDLFFFSGYAFPGYKYGDNLNFAFAQENQKISVRQAIKDYLESNKYPWPYLSERRATVTRGSQKEGGFRRIFEIQGSAHVSPLLSHRVSTRGVVTAIGVNEWYPGGVDMYIQDPEGDGRDDTSDGLHVFLENENTDLQIGDYVVATGVVYEQVMTTGLGRTSLRDAKVNKIPGLVVPLPAPVILGKGGREIPKGAISTHNGNLNLKISLNLSDGIDFWESLEGMRVQVKDLRVVGFRGGHENHESHVGADVKGYLNLYFVTDALDNFEDQSPRGGIVANSATKDFNPEIMQIATNHMTKSFNTNWIFNVGDKIPGVITGVLGYERNIFGEGEYSLLLPI
ncbi:MAG: 5'-nucleotidase C-terminal domain-containing protein, partial [Bdellovibrionales bacterium]|nr:5'-nucleotidase C-terminal domain-containing protein [Bdellovibrionales bacterium]